MDAVAESERNLVRSMRFSLVFENERRADAGRDGQQTCRARRNFQARTGTGKSMFLVQLTTSRTGKVDLPICYYA